MNKKNFKKFLAGAVMALTLITVNVQSAKTEGVKIVPNPKGGHTINFESIDPPGV